jgi:hypothetical protein
MEEVDLLKEESTYVSLLDPFNERELIEALMKKRIASISMEMIPRITRAQKMDVLSSQANLAGYAAVIIAAERLDKIFPMMMTPAGTIAPARVFVIGVGIAGLQAIATAKRLGARVDAFDTRPVVEEQVKSLGARFVKIDLGETGQTKDGYAKALTDEQLQKQREGMAKVWLRGCQKDPFLLTWLWKPAAMSPGHKRIRKLSWTVFASSAWPTCREKWQSTPARCFHPTCLPLSPNSGMKKKNVLSWTLKMKL